VEPDVFGMAAEAGEIVQAENETKCEVSAGELVFLICVR
jgi:hypothetical protein